MSIIIQKPGNTCHTIRSSKLEQASAFTTQVTNFNDPKTVLSNKFELAFSLGLTVQPFVAYVGDGCSFNEKSSYTPFSFYIIINKTHFKVEIVFKAFDVCFKSFHTLNLKYPFEAEQIWRFMQVYFYKIPESRIEKKFLSV